MGGEYRGDLNSTLSLRYIIPVSYGHRALGIPGIIWLMNYDESGEARV